MPSILFPWFGDMHLHILFCAKLNYASNISISMPWFGDMHQRIDLGMLSFSNMQCTTATVTFNVLVHYANTDTSRALWPRWPAPKLTDTFLPSINQIRRI